MAVRPGENFTAGALAEQARAPQDYMAKVLQQLAGAGLVSGRRGVGGGYCLTRAPGEITLRQVIHAVSAPRRNEAAAVDGDSEMGAALRALAEAIERASGTATAALEAKTLADLVAASATNGDGAGARPHAKRAGADRTQA